MMAVDIQGLSERLHLSAPPAPVDSVRWRSLANRRPVYAFSLHRRR